MRLRCQFWTHTFTYSSFKYTLNTLGELCDLESPVKWTLTLCSTPQEYQHFNIPTLLIMCVCVWGAVNTAPLIHSDFHLQQMSRAHISAASQPCWNMISLTLNWQFFLWCVYVWVGGTCTHARVCRRGPTLFCFPLKAEKMECLPPSCPQYRGW